jgi:hypothetical protein
MTEPETVWSCLERFLHGDLSVADFEGWLYLHPETVETAVGPEIGLALLSIDYRGAHPVHEAKKLIERAYELHRTGEVSRDYARRVATEFLEGDRDLWSATRVLSTLRFEGPEGWIPDEFVYIDSELDDIPAPGERFRWDQTAWKRLMGLNTPVVADYERAARVAALSLLERLTHPR